MLQSGLESPFSSSLKKTINSFLQKSVEICGIREKKNSYNPLSQKIRIFATYNF